MLVIFQLKVDFLCFQAVWEAKLVIGTHLGCILTRSGTVPYGLRTGYISKFDIKSSFGDMKKSPRI